MHPLRSIRLLFLIGIFLGPSSYAFATEGGLLAFHDFSALEAQREAWLVKTSDAAVTKLLQRANALLEKPLPLITQKKHLLPGVSPQDYSSTAIYWWKNPATKDGLPYIQRDGVYNPESEEYDRPKLEALGRDTLDLAEAYYITRDSKYAMKAREYFCAWYIDKSSRMNPDFAHAQARPGLNSGSSTGIIEGVAYARNGPDAVTLLHIAGGLPNGDYAKIRAWFASLEEWLETSPFGIEMQHADRNLGTWYDMQRVTYCLFLGEKEKARAILSQVGDHRIARQIKPDGSQPAELARTKAFNYSIYNLSALITLCELGDKAGVDIWHYESKDGASIPAAIDFLIPYASGQKKWPYQEIEGIHPQNLAALLRRIAPHYPRKNYAAEADLLPRGK